jgi:hypothetical protein
MELETISNLKKKAKKIGMEKYSNLTKKDLICEIKKHEKYISQINKKFLFDENFFIYQTGEKISNKKLINFIPQPFQKIYSKPVSELRKKIEPFKVKNSEKLSRDKLLYQLYICMYPKFSIRDCHKTESKLTSSATGHQGTFLSTESKIKSSLKESKIKTSPVRSSMKNKNSIKKVSFGKKSIIRKN